MTVGERRDREADDCLDAVEKLAALRLMLKVSGETSGNGGDGERGAQRSVSAVKSKMVRCSPEVSSKVFACAGWTEIWALRQMVLVLAMVFRGLGMVVKHFRAVYFGAIVVVAEMQ